MKILLDTNFLLIPAQFKIDIFRKLKGNSLITLSSCVKELEKLAKLKSKAGSQAKVTLDLIKKKEIIVIRVVGNADKAILRYSVTNNYVVGTNDKKLIKMLKNKGIKIIRLRQKRYLIGI